MGTGIQIAIVYLLPALGFFFWFFWSATTTRLELAARVVAAIGAISMLASLGLLAKYGVFSSVVWSAAAILGGVARIPRVWEAPLLGEARDLVRGVVIAAGGAALMVSGVALAASARGAEPGVTLTFPVTGGEFLILGGGGGLLGIDAQGAAQHHGVDIVKVDGAGFRADSFWPTSPESFFAWDVPVSAPCDGAVVGLDDDRPDLPPTQSDSASPLGNYVAIACPEVTVVLAHLKRGSLVVPRNTTVRVGDPIARVGASGHAGQAKLRIYAVRGREQTPARLLGQATAVPISFGDGPLVRGDKVSR